MFRLHMDFPLEMSESDCVGTTNKLVNFFEQNKQLLIDMGFTDINYRLGHDDDRQKSNYMIKNENGHVANKKSRIHLLTQNSEVE
jgi:hypothetical protein